MELLLGWAVGSNLTDFDWFVLNVIVLGSVGVAMVGHILFRSK